MKRIKWLPVFLLAVTVALSGCMDRTIPLAYDNQIKADGTFDTNLFYRNDLTTEIADPFVLYISDETSTEYGYYYLYGTTSSLGYEAFRSRDLQNWENISNLKGFLVYSPPEDALAQIYLWAPEVVFDSETRQYYMFYSGAAESAQSLNETHLCVAVSDQPYGPFLPCTENGLSAGKPLLDPDKANAAVAEEARGDWYGIDCSPFIGADGEKYLMFARTLDPSDANHNAIWGMRMKSWSEPDYASLTKLTSVGYRTTERTEKMDYESSTNHNEGPTMLIRTDDQGTPHYYLTFSINGYMDKSYSVIQAVGDSPLGPFRKLDEADGGIIISTDHQTWDHLSGTGHHCFLKIGDEYFAVYHEHINRQTGNSSRYVAFDRVAFTENGKGETVIYVNGPTWSLQPQIEALSEYRNIAQEASVTVSSGKNAEALTDGLLSLYKNIGYVPEFETEKTATITLDFGQYREIAGLMIYNSKYFEKAFPWIERVEFDFKNDQLPKGATASIAELVFDWDSYKNANADDMRPGGSAVAVFAPLLVKTIRITLRLPVERPEAIELTDDEGYIVKQTAAAISEIVVLGK